MHKCFGQSLSACFVCDQRGVTDMVVPCIDVHALRYSFCDPFHIVMSDGSEKCNLQSPGTRAGISMLRRSNSIEDLLLRRGYKMGHLNPELKDDNLRSRLIYWDIPSDP